MEYSKEDLMEAKKQILGVGENMGTEESKKIWEENAQFWDNAMGDESNEFHREVVRPKVTELLSPNPADYILDIACGNGNYSSYLAQRGASVVAFDYSKKMIELAKYGAVFELKSYEEALVPRVYHSFETDEKTDSAFIEYLFATKRPDRELQKLISSGARMDGLLNIDYDSFMGIDLKLPCLEEQLHISGFLRKVDQTITLHQRKAQNDLIRRTILLYAKILILGNSVSLAKCSMGYRTIRSQEQN